MGLTDSIHATAQAVDKAIDKLIPVDAQPQELTDAMRHALLAGGKRIRPYLCVQSFLLFAPECSEIYQAAAAIECIHTFSLIHDDLPALDNDAIRRGLPTVHVKYGESTAILAGDALLALAFEIMAAPSIGTSEQRANACLTLARACGPAGMVGGQIDDLAYEGKRLTPEQLESIHLRKTGALLEASVAIGLIFSGASEEDHRHLQTYARCVGLAFQIMDDILDVTSDTVTLGKPARSDEALDKATYPKLFGLEKAQEMATDLTQQAVLALKPYGVKATHLIDLAHYLLTRSN